MINIGITGQAGFIGTQLYNTLGLFPEEFKRIEFQDEYFESETKLKSFVKECDAIVHLAALNRHKDSKVIYNTNIKLVNQLITVCEETNTNPMIIFSSSTQEDFENDYGKSKKEGGKLFSAWAKKNGSQFIQLKIPNVYGPFGKPFYNSVVATFCYQFTHNETPQINEDREIELIYVSNLANLIIEKIRGKESHDSPSRIRTSPNDESASGEDFLFKVPADVSIKVSALLNILEDFKHKYIKDGIIPNLENPFHRNLFNTLICFIDFDNFYPFQLKSNSDDRGTFVETVKLYSGGQISFSTTKAGVTRGNHYHTRKAERFAVVKGKAQIELRRIGSDKIYSFTLDGNNPSFVDMPIWHTHNIKNIGNEDLYTLFWINEHFNSADPDTFFEDV